MQKAHDASKNNWWRNFPNIDTPITQDELNRVETTVDVIDNRVVGFDLSKANQSDLLQSIKGITYNTETGVWVFTWWNGSTLTVDQNIEKIPVSFSMSPQGVITMTTSDGTQYTCDIATLIKTYSFLDSDTIDFTDTVDSDGNHTITADIKNGSITGEKLQPNYLADCVLAKQGAESAEANAQTSEETALTHQYNAEAWAKGTKNGVPVIPTDEQYHDNAWYWAQQARAIVGDKVDSFNGRIGAVLPADGDYSSNLIAPATGAIPGQVPVVRNVGVGQDIKLEYVNEDLDIGLKPHIIVISETGSTVTLTKGTKVIYANETSPEHFEADVTEFGTWVIDSILSGDDAQVSLVVDAVKIYTIDDSHWHADITVTYPTGGTCSCSKSGTTTLYATGSPYTFTVHQSGIYTITATANGETYTTDVEITTSGQTESLTIPKGSTVTPTDSVATLLSCAGIHDTSITSVSDLLADTTTLLAVINSNNAVDYLVRCTDWAGVGLVPTMTSDTTPSGVCSANPVQTGYGAYKAFDGDESTFWSTGARSGWIQYEFPTPEIVNKVSWLDATTTQRTGTFKIQASNDGFVSETVDLYSGTATAISGEASFSNSTAYKYYRFLHVTPLDNVGFKTLQFYSENICDDQTAMSYIGLNNYAANTLLGTDNPALVPIMTSDTTPSGEASASSVYNNADAYKAYKAFDSNTSTRWCSVFSASTSEWLQYHFPTAKVIRACYLLIVAESGIKTVYTAEISGSNDGTNFTSLKTQSINSASFDGIIQFENDTAYSYYRLTLNGDSVSSNAYIVQTLQLYEKDYDPIVWLEAICNSTYFESVLNVKVPTMTSDTTPSGQVFYSSQYNTEAKSAKTAFGYTGTGWVPAYNTTNNTIGYMFETACAVKKIHVGGYGGTKSTTNKIQASNDGSTWTDLLTNLTLWDNGQGTFADDFIVNNSTNYKYYRIQTIQSVGSSNQATLKPIQFYAREDV